MARADAIPAGALKSVAAEIGRWLQLSLRQNAEIRETIAVVRFERNAIDKTLASELSRTLSGGDLFTPTSFRHHQVWVDGRPEAVAYSRARDADPSWRLAAMSRSAFLAGAVEVGLQRVDEDALNRSNDQVVRMLTVPSRRIKALWAAPATPVAAVGLDRFLVVAAEAGVAREFRHWIGLADFVRSVRQTRAVAGAPVWHPRDERRRR